MNLHRCERAAACVALMLLTLCGAGAGYAFAQKRGASGTQANSRRMPPPTADDERVNQYLDEGQRHADAGNWAEALVAYKLAIVISPRHPEAHIYVGDAYMNLGKYNEAFAAYKEAVRVAPSNAEAHYSLGMAYNDMAMYGDAFKPLAKAISLDSQHAEAHHGLGYAYLKLENFKPALGYLKQAVRLRNDYPEAHFSLGLAYIGSGQLEAAEKQLAVLEGMDKVLAGKLDKELRRDSRVATVAQPEQNARSSANTAAPQSLAVKPPTRELEQGGVTLPQLEQGGVSLPQTAATKDASARTQEAESAAPQTPQPKPTPVARAKQPTGVSASPLDAELTFWDSIKNSDDPEEFAAYLKKYPNGEFAGLARIRLRKLESKRAEAAKAGGEREAAAALTPTKDTAVAPVAVAPRAPTIEETLKLLKEGFSNKLTYTITAPGQDANVVRVTSEVVIEYQPLRFDDCRIEWRDGKDTVTVALSDLDPLKVKVELRSKPNTTFSIPIWNLSLTTVGGEAAIRESKGDGSETVNNYNGLDLQFSNKEKAERMARLLQQAIKLCENSP
jgi:tetratricopeptide (TPR) repeat protein